MNTLTIDGVIEIRESDSGAPTVSGLFPYANRTIISKEGEVFLRGAFARSTRGDNPISLLFDHDTNDLIATTADGLKVTDQQDGLAFESAVSADQVERINRECGGVSVGFSVDRGGEYRSKFGGKTTRIIRACELYEISLVKQAAYSNTQVTTRARRNKWR